MKFRSNTCVAIHLPSLAPAERFYSGVLGFKLRSKTRECLEFDTGKLRLYVNKSAKAQPPTLSFGVKDIARAKQLLAESGCEITVDRGRSLYFRDPFGNIFDVIED